MKIVFCAIGPETSKGILMYGGTRFWIEMGKRWGKKKENEIHVVGSAGTHDICVREGIKAHFHLVPFEFALPFFGVIGRMIKACCLNLKTFNGMIFSPSHFLWDTLPAFCLKKRGTDLTWVAAVHHVIPPPTQRQGGLLRNLLSFVGQKLSFVLIRNADRIVTVNSLVKESLVKLGFSRSKILVMSNGVPYDRLSKIQDDAKNSCDASFMGRLHPAKGVFDLIRIWKRVVESRKKAKLVLIGFGSDEVAERLESELVENGLQQNVHVLGYLPDNEAGRIMKSSKIFIFPSYEEGWGITVCEAMALGLPAVLYDLSAYVDFQDAVEKVAVGDVEAFAQAILKLMSNEKLRAKMAGKAREVAREFDLDQIAEENWSVLMESVKPKNPVIMRHAYDELAEEGYSASHYTSRQIFEICNISSPEGHVLDIGSGCCTHSSYLKEKGFDVIAIDISAAALSKANRNLCRVCADAQSLPFKSNVFDRVLCIEVLEHLPNPEMCIRETRRILTEEGNVLFTIPVFSFPFPKIIIPFLRRSRTCNVPKNYHLHVFRDDELTQMVRRQFTIVRIRHFFQGFSFVSFLTTLHLGKKLDHFLSSHHEGLHLLELFASGIAILAKK